MQEFAICKIWYKSGKKGVIGCKIGIKKGGLMTGTWYPRMYGSAPSPGENMPDLGLFLLSF